MSYGPVELVVLKFEGTNFEGEVLREIQKVVDAGKGDGIFISTSGVGAIEATRQIGPTSISAGDAVWVIASVVAVATGILTTLGVVVTLLIAAAVGDFGTMQFLLRRSTQGDRSLAVG